MNYQIYFPKDVKRNLYNLWKLNNQALIVGYKIDQVYIIVLCIQNDVMNNSKMPPCLEGLQVIGAINNKIYDLCFNFDEDKFPVVQNSSDLYTIILFDPLKYKKLEYFSINPILLQSMSREIYKDDLLVKKFNKLEKSDEKPKRHSITDEIILDKINQIMKTRSSFKNWQNSLNSRNYTFIRIKELIGYCKSFFIKILVYCILIIQNCSIFLVKGLNYKIKETSLVDISHVLRQADLRLKQINYFPIQFLCYYDKSILYTDSMLLKKLNLPIFNSNLNINNSNYINLYNSLWMICNDLLLGNIVLKLIIIYSDKISYYLKVYLMQEILYNKLYSLISWISFNYPAGFKLNNELGSFMGELVLWSLSFWNNLVHSFFGFSSDDHPLLYKIIPVLLRLLCYSGLSFVIAGMLDVCKYVTLHIYCFYYSLSRIYKRQIDIIKSLFQLFRGKKYNVLRDRIDNIDSHSNPGDFFEIYRLLLGTLLFMVLIFLLPTIFAFYMVFFLLHMAILVTLNFLENLLIVINFLPLFVLLLKLKNSNRLQGGINFDFIAVKNTTSYIKLTNKSLSYNEIFSNFIKLLKNSKNFKKSLVQFFFVGEMISMNHDHELKFNYLMLPGNYDKTTEVWKLIE